MVFFQVWTLVGTRPPTAKAIEILLKCRAFVVKRTGAGSNGKPGQLTWSKYPSVGEAWDAAKARAAF